MVDLAGLPSDASPPFPGLEPVVGQPDTWRLHREMGCTEREFHYWLSAALAPFSYTVQGNGVDIVVPPGRIRMQCETLEPRRIALITIARLHLTIEFQGLGADPIQGFLHRWDLYTRRGGG